MHDTFVRPWLEVSTILESLKEVRMKWPIWFAAAVIKSCYARNPVNLASVKRAMLLVFDFFYTWKYKKVLYIEVFWILVAAASFFCMSWSITMTNKIPWGVIEIDLQQTQQ